MPSFSAPRALASRWTLGVLLAISFGLAPRVALANPAEQLGFSTRSTGMANAMVGVEDPLTAPITNPAAGTSGSGIQLGLGYTYAHLSVDINGQDPNSLPVRGLWLAGAIPIELGRAHLSFNLAAYVPDQFLIRAHSVAGTEQRLVLWDNRPHRLVVHATLAADICSWLSIGAGVSILGAVAGNRIDFVIDADPDRTRAESTLNIDFPTLAAPVVGVIVRPIPELRLAARFTDELALDVDLNVNVDVSDPGTPVNGTVDFAFRAPSGFTPRELVLGASGDIGALTLSGEIGWQQWSRVNELTALVSVVADLGAPIPATPFLEPDPNLSDTWNVRLGAEYGIPLGTRELRLRGGYGFAPSPIPAQRGATNYADADRHIGAVGATFAFDLNGARVSLDAAFQLQYMVETTSVKDDPTAPGGDLSVGGPIYLLSLGARVEL